MTMATDACSVDEAVVLLRRCTAVLVALRHAVLTPETDAQRCLAESRAALRAELAERSAAGWPPDPDGRLRDARACVVAAEQELHAAMHRRHTELRQALVRSRTARRATAKYLAA